MEEREFYTTAALYAMQGIQESGYRIEGALATIMPNKLAMLSFEIADAMLSEYRKRMCDFQTAEKKKLND